MDDSRHVDLFLDSLVNAPVKDDRALMEFPFFSLQKQPRMEPLIYDDGRVRVQIDPGKRGIATIWDKDILIYVTTLLNSRLERGLPVERRVRIAAYDLLRSTGRHTGKSDYEALYDALYRLRSTSITTTIEAGGEREVRGFGWIDNFRIIVRDTPSGRKIMESLELTLNDWTMRAIVKDRRVLTISPKYFKLTKGLERRLYELARKHCGYQEKWVIGIEKLAEKCGSMREVRKFKSDLSKIIEADRIPDYQISMEYTIAGKKRGPATVVVRPRL